MRVNLDQSFFGGDRRIDYLAALSGEQAVTTRGRLVQVWYHCYCQRSVEADSIDINRQAEWTGSPSFGELMVTAGLSEALEGGRYRIKGIADRIQYLLEASENGKRGAAKRWGLDGPPIGGLCTPHRVGWHPSPSPSPSPDPDKKTPASTGGAPSQKALFEYFAERLLAVRGIKAIHEGVKTAKHCKHLIDGHGLDTAKAMIDSFVGDNSPGLAEKAWPLGFLMNSRQTYVARCAPRQLASPGIICRGESTGDLL